MCKNNSVEWCKKYEECKKPSSSFKECKKIYKYSEFLLEYDKIIRYK